MLQGVILTFVQADLHAEIRISCDRFLRGFCQYSRVDLLVKLNLDPNGQRYLIHVFIQQINIRIMTHIIPLPYLNSF